jgi:FG-GAP-like repeat/FG-GAP repeat
MTIRGISFRVFAQLVTTLLGTGLLLLLTESGVYGLVCGPSWTTVPLAPGLKLPRALAPIAPNDIWVVGNQVADTQTPLQAEHWNGSSWTLVPTPNVGSGARELNGADGVASSDVWAVGASSGTTANRYKTLVEHWNGSQWQVVASPNVGTNNFDTLTSVDASSNTSAWAVGSYRTPASLGKETLRNTLIERWNGTSWSVVPSPNPGTLSNSLLGVAAIGPSNVWAVGWKLGAQGLRSLVLHYDGTTWRAVGVPTAGTGENVLTSISAVSANDIWAAGYYEDGSQQKTLTLHYDGTSWSQVSSANGADGVSILRDIYASSPSNAWAVGLEYRASLKHYVASTQHWGGSSWSAVPSAISANSAMQSEMFSVAKAPGTSQVWAAGWPQDMEVICPTSSTTQAKPAQISKATTNSDSAAPAASATQTTKTSSAASTAVPVSNTSVVQAAAATPVSAVDKAVDAGISETTLTRGGIITDFNNDGRPDIFLGRHDSNTAQLFISDGSGHYKEIDQGTFVKTDRHGCDAADVNGDGLTDIFCSTGASRGTAAKLNELYVQRPDHTFVNQAGQYGLLDPFSRGRLGTFINADGDSRPDLLVVNETDRLDGMPSTNQLFINQGGSKFRSAPEYNLEREMGFGSYAGNNASVADLDKDGWQDLILVTPSGLRVYHNNQGTGFTNVAAAVGLGQNPADVTLADVNGDTWPDVIEVSANELRVLLNESGTFSSISSIPLQFGVSVAAGDVNSDGQPDIYVMRGKNATGTNAPDQVYLNNGTGTGFAQMTSSIPSTSQGAADFVAPIDYDGNDLTDFLVLNGAEAKPGPVQLIAFFPAP